MAAVAPSNQQTIDSICQGLSPSDELVNELVNGIKAIAANCNLTLKGRRLRVSTERGKTRISVDGSGRNRSRSGSITFHLLHAGAIIEAEVSVPQKKAGNKLCHKRATRLPNGGWQVSAVPPATNQ